MDGPITIFDKSALEGLNPSEACLFGHFYSTNITPLFFVEILADLEKEVRRGRTAEQIVGSLAYKTSALSAYANVHHSMMILSDLMGDLVDFSKRGPILGRGKTVVTGDQSGIIFKQAPEVEALRRWQRHEFLEVEREFARGWRRTLGNLDLEASYRRFQPFIEGTSRPQDLKEAKEVADRLLREPRLGGLHLPLALALLTVPAGFQPSIYERWLQAGTPLLHDFAPYAAHVVTVELFFHLALSADLISRDRASNRADIAYLYYLPFCMVFTSSDHLHAKTVPLFLGHHQEFVWGPDLKADLRRLDEHYSQLPEETKRQGLWSFAKHPPEQGDFVVSHLWDQFLPRWRDRLKQPRKITSPEEEKALLEVMTKLRDGQPRGDEIGIAEAAFVMVENQLPVQMDKWRILPPGVEDKQRSQC